MSDSQCPDCQQWKQRVETAEKAIANARNLVKAFLRQNGPTFHKRTKKHWKHLLKDLGF